MVIAILRGGIISNDWLFRLSGKRQTTEVSFDNFDVVLRLKGPALGCLLYTRLPRESEGECVNSDNRFK